MAKIEIDKTALQKALMVLSSGMPSKAIVPADGVYKFDIEKDKCYVSISNFNMEMQIYLQCKSDEETSFCTPQYIMENTIKNFPDGIVKITTERNEEDTTTLNVSLTPEGKRKKYKVACSGYESNFPHWPDIEEETNISFKTSMEGFSERIKIAGSNVDPNDPTQVYQNISLLNNSGKIMMVAGNSHLAVGIDTDYKTEAEVVIPSSINKAMSQLGGSGEVDVAITNKRVYILYSSVSVKLKMHEHKPPPYMSIFDKEPETGILIDREEMLGTLKRMIGVGMEFSRIVLECGSESLKVYSVNHDFGHEGEEFLEVTNPKNFKIALKAKFLLRALTSTKSDKIYLKVIGIGESKQPVFITPEDQSIPLKWIIAPMAI